MANIGDKKERIQNLADTSRNKRQASVLLTEIARQRSETATRKCAQSAKLVNDCRQTYARAKKLRDHLAGQM